MRVVLLVVLVLLTVPRTAFGAEAPGLALENAHRTANALLREMVRALPPATQKRVTGIYVAFDGAALDPYALAACDDDGDYVVVVSDALIVLADFVAQTAAIDEVFEGVHALESYAAFTAREQRHGARVLPPPAGTFTVEQASDPRAVERAEALFRGIAASLVAHELAHAALGHLVCASPTATHERNDDLWSARERESALALASRLYTPSRVLDADRSAAWILSLGDAAEAGRHDGALAWLSFADAVESQHGRALATYLHHHPGSRARKAVTGSTAVLLDPRRGKAL